KNLTGSLAASAGCGRVAFREQLTDGGFVGLAAARAEHAPHLLSVFVIQKRGRERAIPTRPDGLSKSGLVAVLFSVVGKDRFVARNETARQDQIAFIIKI